MQLLTGVWTTVTTVLSYLSLSPLPDAASNDQTLLAVPQLQPSSIDSPAPFSTAGDDAPGPTFAPVGASPNFKCEYPTMRGWKYCGTSEHRQCWLQSDKNGNRFDVFSNYEEKMPTGILRKYTINLTDSSWDKDGMVFSEAKLFDNTYPGPWIEACWGDTVQINVTNLLEYNGTSVHWHGIRQLNSTHMDGVNGITQCPIAPKDYFVYNWTARQYGSSWYHSHYSVQYADGAAGPLTLYGPSSANYDEAVKPILMTDWGHSSAFVNSTPTQPDILLNGRGNITRYNHSALPADGIIIEPPYTIDFTGPMPGQRVKKYLLRIMNISYNTTFVVSIDNHLMQIVSADFVPISPYSNTSVLVGIGQRYNVIVDANPIETNLTGRLDPNGNYWIRTEVANCFGRQRGGDKGYEETGIIRYNPLSVADPTSKKWGNVSLNCSDETYTDLHPIFQWTIPDPSPYELQRDFQASFKSISKYERPYPLASFSLDLGSNFVPMRIDYADPAFLNLNNSGHWDNPAWRIVPENKNATDWVYLVIESGGEHPMHLHGHDFALLEQAYGKKFNKDPLNLQLLNPPRRDVVLLPKSGYVVIAFKADNPGPWLIHCHIAKHISEGLGMTIMERQPSALDLWPDNSPEVEEAKRVCGNWKTWQSDKSNWALNLNCAEDDHWRKYPELCFQDDSGV